MSISAHVNAPAVKDGRSAGPDAFKELVADLAHEIGGHLVQFSAIESLSGKPPAAGDQRPVPSQCRAPKP